MGQWYTVDTVKKVFTFDVRPNTPINIEVFCGVKIKNPTILYYFKRCIGYYAKFDGRVKMTGSYPIYTFNVDSSTIDINNSIINVLIMDGDE